MTAKQPIVRRATQRDVAAITALTDAAYRIYIPKMGRKPQPMTTDYAQVVNEHPVWLIEIEQRLVGVLVLQHELDAMLIYSVAVNPTDQKRGFGHMLLAWAEQQARQAGHTSIRLYTNALMEANIALYSRLGYGETRRESYVGGMVVHMNKPLKPNSCSN